MSWVRDEAFRKQLHRLGLFAGTWALAGSIGYGVAVKKGLGADTEFGKFGEALKGIPDVWALGIGVAVPGAGAVVAFGIWLLVSRAERARRVREEAQQDMKELGNDAVAVLYNGLSFAGIALFVCTALNVYSDWFRWLALGLICWGIAVLLAYVVSRLPRAFSQAFPNKVPSLRAAGEESMAIAAKDVEHSR